MLDNYKAQFINLHTAHCVRAVYQLEWSVFFYFKPETTDFWPNKLLTQHWKTFRSHCQFIKYGSSVSGPMLQTMTLLVHRWRHSSSTVVEKVHGGRCLGRTFVWTVSETKSQSWLNAHDFFYSNQVLVPKTQPNYNHFTAKSCTCKTD